MLLFQLKNLRQSFFCLFVFLVDNTTRVTSKAWWRFFSCLVLLVCKCEKTKIEFGCFYSALKSKKTKEATYPPCRTTGAVWRIYKDSLRWCHDSSFLDYGSVGCVCNTIGGNRRIWARPHPQTVSVCEHPNPATFCLEELSKKFQVKWISWLFILQTFVGWQNLTSNCRLF